jgi:hypothetical protein
LEHRFQKRFLVADWRKDGEKIQTLADDLRIADVHFDGTIRRG